MKFISKDGKEFKVDREFLINKSPYWRNISSPDINITEVKLEYSNEVIEQLVDYINFGGIDVDMVKDQDIFFKLGEVFAFKDWNREFTYWKEIYPLEKKVEDKNDSGNNIILYLRKMGEDYERIVKNIDKFPYTSIKEVDIPLYKEFLENIMKL